jgi:hypothetical protein
MMKAESGMRHKWLVALLLGGAFYIVWHYWPAPPMVEPDDPPAIRSTNPPSALPK